MEARGDAPIEYLKAYMDYRNILRQLAMGDISFAETILCDGSDGMSASRLDPRTAAFVRLGALVASGTSPSGFQSHVDAAFAAGATTEEIVSVLIAVAPTAGLAKVMLAAPSIGLAVGYDTDVALEVLDVE